MATPHDTDVNDNPFFGDVGLSGLLDNLGNRPPPGLFIMDDYEPKRLKAIAQQAENVKDAATKGLRAVGTLLAIANTTGDVAEDTNNDAGWLVEFLAELTQCADLIEANANLALTHS